MEESSRILYIPKAILSLLDKGKFKAYEMLTGNRFCCLTHDLSILFGKPINLVFSHLLDNAHKHRKMGGRGVYPPKLDSNTEIRFIRETFLQEQ